MNAQKLSISLLLIILSNSAFAFYGSGTSNHKTCAPPELTQFNPPHLSVVPPQSEFSFFVPKGTRPKSIVVSVKKQSVDMIISEAEKGYTVSGKLPSSLQDTYARVEIKATTAAGCKGNGGWLLNIRNKEKPVANI
ncbi:MAG: hypothetical protein JKY01_02535 [Pseudomonadales bacterium]|nr:hypothetical protein [Pseudomonadales bacterium]